MALTASKPVQQKKASVLLACLALCVALPLGWATVKLVPHDHGSAAIAGTPRVLADGSADVAHARLALASTPVSGTAYRILATEANENGIAERLWRHALRWAPRAPLVRGHMAEKALLDGDLADALVHLDALMRAEPSSQKVLLPIIAQLLAEPGAVPLLVERLQHQPSWRGALAPHILQAELAPQVAEDFWTALAKSTDLSDKEQRHRLEQWMASGKAGQARQYWAQALDPSDRAFVDLLFDGGFESQNSTGEPFAWQLPLANGVAAYPDGSHAQGGQHSLRLDFSGRSVRLDGPRQMLVLDPGQYVLEASTDNRTGSPRAFAWQLRCGSQTIAELSLPRAPGWRVHDVHFTVETSCTVAHELRLVHHGRTLQERLLRGSLWLDELRIRPSPR